MNGLSRRSTLGAALSGLVATACRPAATRAPEAADARLFAAPGGTAVGLDVALAAMQASDVVMIGEQHGHPLGLALAATLVERLFAGPTGADAALSFEFFERDQQGVIDQYLQGTLDEAGLRAATKMESERKLPEGHRRMLAAARAAGRPVLAANAPRRLVKLARTEGLAALERLPADERALVEVPTSMTAGSYREAFFKLMGGGHAGADAAALEGFYRAQNVWDATMAATIVSAVDAGMRPVVQVVGSFHVDHGGGLLERVRAARPTAKVWTLSVVDVAARALRAEDRTRADVVAYVGPQAST